jgi:hypothetical protein
MAATDRFSLYSQWSPPSYPLLRGNAGRLERLQLGGAILELRDLAEGIERGVGEKVRRRFHKGKGNVDDAIGHAAI